MATMQLDAEQWVTIFLALGGAENHLANGFAKDQVRKAIDFMKDIWRPPPPFDFDKEMARLFGDSLDKNLFCRRIRTCGPAETSSLQIYGSCLSWQAR